MHCKAKKNDCHGIAECFCECDLCLEADNLASEVKAGVGFDEVEAPAVTEHFENQDGA